MEWCHLWHCLHELTQIAASVALHDQQSYVASHFDYLCWSNVVLPLMIPLPSHDADASSITGAKCNVTSPFDHPDLTNGMVPLMILLALCDTDTSIMALHDQKCYITHCLNHLDLINTVVLLTMTLASYGADTQCQQYQMTEKVMLRLISIILNYKAAVLLMMHQYHEILTLALYNKHSFFTLFQPSWTNKQNSTINSATSVIW